MYVFGLDCSTRVTALAIVDEDKVIAETFLHIDRPHSERLIPLIEQLFAVSGLSVADMDGLAIAVGPGSFTGLRIGLATVKGLAHPLGIPVIGVSTLDALAQNGWPHDGLVCPVLDARKSEVYTCLYQGNDSGMKRLIDYQAISLPGLMEQLRGWLSDSNARVLFLGDGVGVYREMLIDEFGEHALFAVPEMCYPRGSQVARLGLKGFQRGEADELHTLVPMYIRASEAEVSWAKKHGQFSSEA